MQRFLFLVLLAFGGGCAAAEDGPGEGAAPVLVLVVSNPWGMVMGADSPRVAMYANGDVIYRPPAEGRTGHRMDYLYARLDPAALQPWLDESGRIASIPGLRSDYSITDMTDQPTASFYIRHEGKDVALMVYGLGCGDPSAVSSRQRKRDERPPAALWDLAHRLCTFDPPRSQAWAPRQVEVMFWDYANAPEASTAWPEAWPALSSPTTVRRGELYSVYLDGALLPRLRAFLAGLPDKGAILIEGRKMTASYRLPLPGEPVWRKAFVAAMRGSSAEP